LNLEKILTSYTDQKQRENFLEELFSEAVEAKNLILLIDNFDKYIANGTDRVDLSISIEKYAKVGSLQFIGITSPFFYERFILTNEKMIRLFNKIDVGEISQDEAKQTLMEMTYSIEQRNNVLIPL
jgi:ATP-dependent Clp protease ATP-binding subunit ClpA